MSPRHEKDGGNAELRDSGTLDFRVCSSISGLRCASEAAPLERAMKRVNGVRDATVNSLRDRVVLEVDALTRVSGLIAVLEAHGYPVDPGEICVTTWLADKRERLESLRRELNAAPFVGSCTMSGATGRHDLRLAIKPGWATELRKICDRLCAAASTLGSAPGSGAGTAPRLPRAR